jgi:hypothetical protein
MKRMAIVFSLVILIAGLVPILAFVFAGEPRKDNTFQKQKLDANDLAEVFGVNVYKFQVNMPKGQKFQVILRELKEKGAEPKVLYLHSFLKESDGPTVIRTTFLRRDGKFEGVLLSEEKDAQYGIQCSGCSPGGVGSIAPMPLANLPGTHKILSVTQSDKHAKQMGLKGMQLITIIAREPGKVLPIDAGVTTFPRAELVIVPEE